MPNIEMNATQTLAELEKIKQQVLLVENTIKEANTTAASGLKNYTKAVNLAVLAENERVIANNVGAASITANNDITNGSIVQLGLLSAQLNGAASALSAYAAAWNTASASVGLHSINLSMNTSMMMQNIGAIMQHTMTLTTDTAIMNINAVSTAVSTLMNQLNSSSLVSVNDQLRLQYQNLNNSSQALLSNSVATLINMIANLGNWLATSLLNKETTKYSDTIKSISETLKNNNKDTLINIIANLGNWLSTKLLNKELSKQLTYTKQQTVSQNLLNGALAAAAILKNPLIGAATVAGAAIAQGLISGQKTEPIGISMNSSQQSSEKDISLSEISSKNSKGGGTLESLILVDKERETSKDFNIFGSASIVGGSLPKLASGGVVKKPTIAMIGEGKYDEAVIPLGNSPQFRNLKADIANAVVQSLMAIRAMETNKVNSGGDTQSLTMYMDGQKMAELLLPRLISEQKKKSNLKLIGV